MHNVTSFELNYLGLDSEEFTKLEEFTLEERLIAWILIIMEYFVQFINIPFGVINIRIIYSTSLLHCNLKFILLFQSGLIVFEALIRLFFVGPVKYFTGDIFWFQTEFRFLPVEYLVQLPIFSRMIFCHLIIIERICATIFVKCYETEKGRLFTGLWIFIFFILSILNFVYKEDQEQSDNLSSQKVSLTTALIAILLALIGLIEIILMGVIWHYNKNKLTKKFTNSSQLSIIGGKPVVVINVHRRTSDYKLKKRYQYLENMRIAFQLAPTLLAYFVAGVLTAFSQTFYSIFFEADDFTSEIISQLNNLAIACINLLIISTTIFFHKILRRNFLKICSEIFCCVPKMKKLQNQSTINKISPTLAQQQTERYFAMLKGTWE